MKKTLTRFIPCFLILLVLTACDPVFPPGNIRVISPPEPLYQGDSFNIEIIYPNMGGTAVHNWKNQNIEILEGDGIIEVYGLTITGLNPGDARIKVNVTAVLHPLATGYTERVYSTEVSIGVEEKK
jgi:hypothetical protein